MGATRRHGIGEAKDPEGQGTKSIKKLACFISISRNNKYSDGLLGRYITFRIDE